MQEFTLNKQAYTVGGMVARGDIPWDEAREELIAAAKRMPAYGKPWRKLDAKVERALEEEWRGRCRRATATVIRDSQS